MRQVVLEPCEDKAGIESFAVHGGRKGGPQRLRGIEIELEPRNDCSIPNFCLLNS